MTTTPARIVPAEYAHHMITARDAAMVAACHMAIATRDAYAAMVAARDAYRDATRDARDAYTARDARATRDAYITLTHARDAYRDARDAYRDATRDAYTAATLTHARDAAMVAAYSGHKMDTVKYVIAQNLIDAHACTPLQAVMIAHNTHVAACRAHLRIVRMEQNAAYDGMSRDDRAIAAFAAVCEDSGIASLKESMCDGTRGYARGFVTLQKHVPYDRATKTPAHYDVIAHVRIPAMRGRVYVAKMMNATPDSAPALYAAYPCEGKSARDLESAVNNTRAIRVPSGDYLKCDKRGNAVPVRESIKKLVDTRIAPAARAAVALAADTLTPNTLTPNTACDTYRVRYVPTLKVC